MGCFRLVRSSVLFYHRRSLLKVQVHRVEEVSEILFRIIYFRGKNENIDQTFISSPRPSLKLCNKHL